MKRNQPLPAIHCAVKSVAIAAARPRAKWRPSAIASWWEPCNEIRPLAFDYFMKVPRPIIRSMARLAVCIPLFGFTARAEPEEVKAKPPFWAEKGVLTYRVFTPDADDTLVHAEKGIEIVSNLLDDSVPQIAFFGGLIGHDHPGGWNWDGLWPYWNRVTFRTGDWKNLSGFMSRTRKNSNASISFHLNLTDVNTGLHDYPESQEFFKKLVETKSIYRRDWNKETNKRDMEPPYVPQDFPSTVDPNGGMDNPINIFALVNYKNFWDSGLAKKMFDEFYGHLPYAPPFLYLDVLNLSGGNFSTGFPDGPLGGSEQTQAEGAIALVDYLREKGTDTGTEGDRPFLGKRPNGEQRAGYVWYHGLGYSNDDYSVISGGQKISMVGHHVNGNPGAFAVAPVAMTTEGLQTVRSHYEALLAGRPGVKTVAGIETSHITKRSSENKVDEFDVPGANGDVFRGDWADLVNYFYLATIQENFHMGNRSVRQRFDSTGVVHLGTYSVSGPGGEQSVLVADFVTGWTKEGAVKARRIMLESPLATTVTVAKAGIYSLKVNCLHSGGHSSNPQLGIYVNGKHLQSFDHLDIPNDGVLKLDAGQIELKKGENTIAFDSGPVRATWSDGTVAEWATPYLNKGFKAWNGDVLFAYDYDRMWPDTWSGQEKIYFFSWDGTRRTWKLPQDWAAVKTATLYPLTPAGRGQGMTIPINERSAKPKLLPQVPYVLVPDVR
jgi:hypothetical protein